MGFHPVAVAPTNHKEQITQINTVRNMYEYTFKLSECNVSCLIERVTTSINHNHI
jgi:hypothetical protein